MCCCVMVLRMDVKWMKRQMKGKTQNSRRHAKRSPEAVQGNRQRCGVRVAEEIQMPDPMRREAMQAGKCYAYALCLMSKHDMGISDASLQWWQIASS